ncbi:hypothetical protein BCR33DRAFT_858117 [Rhizoclosmatium globosum]|uniref:Uncharacterized protein n=1 Tax=Rhizoclosmatium globosum TaxID=329046 RepID=A0A1Y2B071_9FUNG|nr:hypothetical protein BCR33DRAFT_858117 [Rhizoclosmatium globosum]|eukprot:ORY28238.1 hypothetical protein BCR33DRAFT_858117 [Rhizoclosmatium globosum]
MSLTISDACNISLLSMTQESGICFRFPDPAITDPAAKEAARNKCFCQNIDTNAVLAKCATDDQTQWAPSFQSYLTGRLTACKNVSLPTDGILTTLPAASTPLPVNDPCAIAQQSLVQESGICYRFPDPSITDPAALDIARNKCSCQTIDTNQVLRLCATTDQSLWLPTFNSYLKGRLDACKSASLSTDGILTGLSATGTTAVVVPTTAPVVTTVVATTVPVATTVVAATTKATIDTKTSLQTAGAVELSVNGVLISAFAIASFLLF